MSAPWGRLWMLRDGGGWPRGHIVSKPNHEHGMAGYSTCGAYCTVPRWSYPMRVRGGAWEAVWNTAVLGDRLIGARQKGKKPPAERKNHARFTKKNGGFETRATPRTEKSGIFYLEKGRFSVKENGAAPDRGGALCLPTPKAASTPASRACVSGRTAPFRRGARR